MLTILAVAIRVLSNSTANLYQKKAAKISSPVVTNMIAYLVMSLICLIPAIFVDWSVYNAKFWMYVVIACILCTVGTISLIEALRVGELSVLAPINSYKSIIGLLSAFILIGEIPSLKEFVCIAFIILGSYFVLDEEKSRFSIKTFWRRDVRLRIFALLCSGIEASFLKKIIMMSSYKISLILWCICGFLCSFVIYMFKNGRRELFSKDNYSNCVIIGVMLLTMQLATNYVFSKMAVGSALALFQLSSLVSLYFGYKVYHESNMRRKLIGTIIMISAAAGILV